MFLIKGEMLVNSREYAGTMLKAGEFMLQPISSKIEMLAMTDVECIYYQFNQPELFCDIRYNRIMKETDPPLIPSPLPIIPELQHFLESARTYLSEKKICRDLLSLKRKELAFILGYFYSDYDLASLVHPLSKYTSSFECFVYQNYKKVKTVEEFAKLGGYSQTTFRRIFDHVFMSRCMSGCLVAAKRRSFTNFRIQRLPSLKSVINSGSNLYRISQTSVKSHLVPRHAAFD